MCGDANIPAQVSVVVELYQTNGAFDGACSGRDCQGI